MLPTPSAENIVNRSPGYIKFFGKICSGFLSPTSYLHYLLGRKLGTTICFAFWPCSISVPVIRIFFFCSIAKIRYSAVRLIQRSVSYLLTYGTLAYECFGYEPVNEPVSSNPFIRKTYRWVAIDEGSCFQQYPAATTSYAFPALAGTRNAPNAAHTAYKVQTFVSDDIAPALWRRLVHSRTPLRSGPVVALDSTTGLLQLILP